MKTQHTMILVGLTALCAIAGGCKKEEPETPPQPTQTVAPPPTQTAPPTPPPQTGCDAANMAAFTGIFTGRAPTEAPKMQMEGSMVCGNVTEGGTVSGNSFFMELGKCYTVISNGLPNVTEIDVQLVIDPTAAGLPPNIAALASAPLAQDSETGAMGTIGPKTNCYRLPPFALVPVPVKVVVKARTGSGPIGAQVYSRKG
ncbi:MAG: hypothetical protein HOW73_13985 [Polyangiaceae bacterium]|nr:hypothetical protein [Polyangiaceae bacterium]